MNRKSYLNTDKGKASRMEIIMCCWKNLLRKLCISNGMKSKVLCFDKEKSLFTFERFFLRIFLKRLGPNLNITYRVVTKKMQECIIVFMVVTLFNAQYQNQESSDHGERREFCQLTEVIQTLFKYDATVLNVSATHQTCSRSSANYVEYRQIKLNFGKKVSFLGEIC